jgi:hypothetical protein
VNYTVNEKPVVDEFKINNLQDLNAEKMEEEKNLKSREKKLFKKIRAHEEDKSRFAVEKRKFELNNNAAQDTESSQTEADVNNNVAIVSQNLP